MKDLTKSKWFLFLRSNYRYVFITVAFLVWMTFLDDYNFINTHYLNKQIEELENNKKYYQEEINKDKQSIKKLKNGEETEKYAREKYYMKRPNEDVFIIEFEGDSTRTGSDLWTPLPR